MTSRKETINSLRALRQPVTLFGEDDYARYQRLCKFEQEKGDDEGRNGERNFFQEEKKMDEEHEEKDGESANIHINIGELTQDDVIESTERFNVKHYNYKKFEINLKKDSRIMKCDVILSWIKKMMKEWVADMDKHGEEWKKSGYGKAEAGMYRQCRRYIKPLIKHLKKYELHDEILDGLYYVIRYTFIKEYVKAHDKYLELSIGNAPWPMGVTMVGIHERSGRSRIFTSQVAHILNDETQRKYLQSIKRLLSICQKHYPSDPSKTVAT